jgi:uncharacterized protein (TIGR02646 family)
MMRRAFSEQSFKSLLANPDKWASKALEARKAVCEQVGRGEKAEFSQEIWKQTKPSIMALFHGKCSYCEVPFSDNFPGDVEHYRPKGEVKGKDHPGYYWLAYEPTNLLLSCATCNQTHKGTNFPVRDDRYWRDYQNSNDEIPLLLNPYYDSPFSHLEYTFKYGERGVEPNGWIEGRCERGTTTIAILKLNRGTLPERRQEAQTDEIIKYDSYRSKGSGGLAEYVQELMKDRRPFTTARLAAVKAFVHWKAQQNLKDEEEIERLVFKPDQR